LARLARARIAARDRRVQQLRRQLEACGVGARLAAIRTDLVAARGRLNGAIYRSHHGYTAQLAGLSGRLDSLSPLAVLGRGYAVAWNDGRTRVLRDASTVAPGETVHVTLVRGELDCEVKNNTAEAAALKS